MTVPTTPAPANRARPDRPEVRRRSWAEVRWRQFRNAPRPVVRAVTADLTVALLLGVVYLAYDLALTRGGSLPGGDLRTLFVVIFVLVVLGAGSFITWLVVPQPGRPGRRSGWSAALGFFAAVPIAYLVLVLVVQVLKPLLL